MTVVRLVVLLAILCLPVAVRAQLAATFGPRGEIAELRVGDVTYLTNLAIFVVKPGWGGSVVDQRTLDPSAVHVEKQGGTTVYTATLTGAEGAAKLRETATVGSGFVTVQYELTPEREMRTETVLVEGTVPAGPHAGKTRWVLGDADPLSGTCPAELNAASYVMFGGRAAEWLGLAHPAGTALRLAPAGLTLQFQDDRKWNTPGFGLLGSIEGGVLPAGKTMRCAVTFTMTTAAKLDADAKALAATDLAGITYSDNRKLDVRSAAVDRRTVPVLGTVEMTADVAATYANAFDPDQIAVSAEVQRPDGTRVSVPGFYCVPMRLETRLGAERTRMAGSPGFRVRYTPTQPGAYRLTLKGTDRTGTVTAKPINIQATASTDPGFIRVSARSPHYFAYDNGRPYFAVGENVCWANGRDPLAKYAAWFKGLGAAGGNWARLWLAFNEKGLEWMPAPTPKPGTGTYLGLGRYAQDNSFRLDQVARLARENGIKLMFCLGTYGEFTEGGYFGEGSWASNPYNAKNGGPCATPQDFWTDARARKLYKQRLRYLVARWGASPDLFAWEFWNEVPASPAQSAWVAEMAAYLKRIDPNRHLVSTTYGSAATWRCPDVDFTMQHMYGQAGNTPDFTNRIVDEARAGLAYGKPYLLAEFGIDWQTSDTKWDPKGIGTNMHNGAWASVMSGAAGTSMLWYWDGYVHPLNVYHALTSVRRFVDTVDWARTSFERLDGVGLETTSGAPEAYSDVTVPADVEWGATPSSEYTLRPDGKVSGGPVAMTIGSPGRGNKGELPTRLTWNLDLRQPTRVMLKLGQVSTRAHLLVSVDGKPAVDRELLAGEPGKGPWKKSVWLEQYKIWQSDYDEDIPVEVPAGAHTLSIANTEGDWLQIRSITVPGYRSSRYPDLNAVGLRSDRLVLLWLHNRASTWRADFDGKPVPAVNGLRVSVPVPADGMWRVEWWDTWEGRVTVRDTLEAKEGKLLLTPPAFARDMAVRCERAGS